MTYYSRQDEHGHRYCEESLIQAIPARTLASAAAKDDGSRHSEKEDEESCTI